MLDFLTPKFTFFQDWYWWVLMLPVFLATYIQGVGFNLEYQTGVPRAYFGKMYSHLPIVRLPCWLAMLVLSGWLSAITSIVMMFFLGIFVAGITRRHAQLMLEQADKQSDTN